MSTDDIELLARGAWRIYKEHGPSDAMTWDRFGEHGKETWRDIVRSVLAAAQPPAPAHDTTEGQAGLDRKFAAAWAAVIGGVEWNPGDHDSIGGVTKDEALEYAADFLKAYAQARLADPVRGGGSDG